MTPAPLILPKLLVLDKEGLISANSRHEHSPFYRITERFRFVLKPNVREAFELIFASEVDFVICTKQRALSDGTMSEKSFAEMWQILCHEVTPKHFCHISIPLYVEKDHPTKREQFARIIEDYRKSDVKPHEITVLDDSFEECEAAASLGMNPIQTTNLWVSACEIFGVQP